MCEAALPSGSDHVFQVGRVIKDDLIAAVLALSPLAATHRLQHGFQTAVESGQVTLRQQRGHAAAAAAEGVAGQRGPHGVAEAILRQGQETQAEPSGVTDSGGRFRQKVRRV